MLTFGWSMNVLMKFCGIQMLMVEVNMRRDCLSGVMQKNVYKGDSGRCDVRLEEDRQWQASRLVHLMKHQLPWDASLWAVKLAGSFMEGSDVRLHYLVKEHSG